MTDFDNQSTQRLIFGTMRLHEVDRSASDWVKFFIQMRKLGVTKLHSSSEYDSYSLFRQILQQLKAADASISFEHIVKLAEPSFDDDAFDGMRLRQKVDAYCDELGTDHIDDVQWMWRHNLNDDSDRVSQFKRTSDNIFEMSEKLKAYGRIKRFLCFPYSTDFADAAIEMQGVDGLVIYRNTQELEYDDAVRSCEKLGKAAIAIRPLNAGKVLDSDQRSASDLFNFALNLKPIEAGIMSTSNLEHLQQLLD